MGQLREAYDATVKANDLVTDVDKALVQAGQTIVDQIDDILERDDVDAQTVTKTLYLLPHLSNVLKEMLATPASRHTAKIKSEEAVKGRLATLRSIRDTGS